MKTCLIFTFAIFILVFSSTAQFIPEGKFLKLEQDSVDENIFVAKFYHPNGKLAEYWTMASFANEINSGNFNDLLSNGLIIPNGKHYTFYPNSRIKFEETYFYGIRTGEFKGYYVDGKVKYAGNYNLEKEGSTTYFFPDGSIRKKDHKVFGIIRGRIMEYYPDLTVLSETNYSEGKKHGKSKMYYPNGKIKRETVYNQNEIRSEKCFDNSGKPTECQPLITGPEFAGGFEAFKCELAKIAFECPSSENEISTCFVILTIDSLGNSELTDVISQVGKPLYLAVNNWIKQLPKFVPATYDGNNVESQCILEMPIQNGKIVSLAEPIKTTTLGKGYHEQGDIITTNWELTSDDIDFQTTVSDLPQFPGGESSLKNYIATNLRYPYEAMLRGIQGTVYVNFIINKLGIVTNAVVENKINPYLGAEALRVVNMLPYWKPGYIDGNRVKTSYTVPIKFVLK